MKIKYIAPLFAFYSFALFSCDQTTVISDSRDQFFDLKSYFEKEQLSLKKIKTVIKRAKIDGVLEEKTLNNINFKEELALFTDSDINKISWLDKYNVDTSRQDNNTLIISYSANDKNLKTDSLIIHFKNDTVQQINILRKTSSLAAKLEQELIYKPNLGYSIRSYQKASLSDSHVLELDVQFVQ